MCFNLGMRLRRDFEEMEKRRMRGVAMLEKGISQSEVARRLGVRRQSVHEWTKVVKTTGKEGLKRQPAGRPSRLSREQLLRLPALLVEGPEQFGYATALWTTQRVAKVIQKEFGVKYHPDHVYKLLRELGWSCQRPTGRARERDEAGIAHWKRVEWPRIKKKP
jgi:transposase